MTAMRLLQQEFATGEMGFTMSICAATIRQAECLKGVNTTELMHRSKQHRYSRQLRLARDERLPSHSITSLAVANNVEFRHLVIWNVTRFCASKYLIRHHGKAVKQVY